MPIHHLWHSGFLCILQAANYLEQAEYDTGNHDEDLKAQSLVRQLLYNPKLRAACPLPFDEAKLWQGQSGPELKQQIQKQFRNIRYLFFALYYSVSLLSREEKAMDYVFWGVVVRRISVISQLQRLYSIGKENDTSTRECHLLFILNDIVFKLSWFSFHLFSNFSQYLLKTFSFSRFSFNSLTIYACTKN